MKKHIFAGFLTIILTVSSVFCQDAQEIIKNVQNKYSSINDAKASFTQTVKPNSGKAYSSSGTLYIQKEDKYRIETKSQILITDGVTSWSYTPSKKQVVIDNYKETGNNFSPNKYLFKYPENFYSDLEGEEDVNGKTCHVIKLSPRSRGNIKSSKIWVDKEESVIRKIYIVTAESSTTYTLKNIVLDAGISSSKFTFTPPQDVEVIDMR